MYTSYLSVLSVSIVLLAHSPPEDASPILAEAAWVVRNEVRRTAYRDQVKLWEKSSQVGKTETSIESTKTWETRSTAARPTLNDPEAAKVSEEGGSGEEDADENDGDESDGGSE
ncbi:hypothetical protein BDR07DRAFT_1380335 [Suillus spraguei]|nr:hypothetical protein BDR07DRAFT_1380335 [Suillus spraguei]